MIPLPAARARRWPSTRHHCHDHHLHHPGPAAVSCPVPAVGHRVPSAACAAVAAGWPHVPRHCGAVGLFADHRSPAGCGLITHHITKTQPCNALLQSKESSSAHIQAFCVATFPTCTPPSKRNWAGQFLPMSLAAMQWQIKSKKRLRMIFFRSALVNLILLSNHDRPAPRHA